MGAATVGQLGTSLEMRPTLGAGRAKQNYQTPQLPNYQITICLVPGENAAEGLAQAILVRGAERAELQTGP